MLLDYCFDQQPLGELSTKKHVNGHPSGVARFELCPDSELSFTMCLSLFHQLLVKMRVCHSEQWQSVQGLNQCFHHNPVNMG